MLTLYEHPFALDCQKVLIAFNRQGVAYDVLEEQRDFAAPNWPSSGRRRRSRCCATATRSSVRRRSSSSTSRALGSCLRWRPANGTVSATNGGHPHLTRYYRTLAKRPSFARVISDARPYRHLFPLPWPADFDRYH